MFVRFRETATRLQMSVTETRRLNGRVQNEHVASFGSVPLPLTVPDRIEFWRRLHDRLAKLSNRIDAATQAKILGQIHARVPMVTAEEQRTLQVDNAKEDLRHWSAIHVQAAQERLDRLDRGEDVPGGLHRSMTREEADGILLAAGLTKADILTWRR